MIAPVDYPKAVLALTEYACGGELGRSYLGDPVYQAVTEMRQEQTEKIRQRQLLQGVPREKLAFYSSCADLVHWLYFRLGVRLGWINRDEMRASTNQGWRVELNISLLSQPRMNSCVEMAKPGDQYAPGDCLHIGLPGTNQDHVMIVRSHDPKTGAVEVAEYGQPGGAIHTHQLVTKSGRVYMGQRQLLTVLRLQNVLLKADAQNKLEPPDLFALDTAEDWAHEPPTLPG
jgi:hypothetical protein